MPTLTRRRFVIAAGGLSMTRGASAQERVRRIGAVFGGSSTTHKRALAALVAGLEELGWQEGRNLVIDARWAEGHIGRVPALAAEVVRAAPDVIVTAGNPVIAEVRKATRTVPIVMATGSDPVAAGFVASLARPGGNLTGVTGFYESTPVKMIEVVSELVPGGSRIAAMFERNTVFTQARYRSDLVKSAEGYHLKVDTHEVAAPDDLDRVLRAVANDRRAALLILPGPMIFAFHERLVAGAEKLAMPVVYPFEEMAEAGGLISYAPNLLDSYRSAARYVDRILRGTHPGDLPIEQPKRLQLAVNLRTARSKGIRLPGSILGRADRFIE